MTFESLVQSCQRVAQKLGFDIGASTETSVLDSLDTLEFQHLLEEELNACLPEDLMDEAKTFGVVFKRLCDYFKIEEVIDNGMQEENGEGRQGQVILEDL